MEATTERVTAIPIIALTYEQRIAMANAWLAEHKGELVPCKALISGMIREQICVERQGRYPIWERKFENGMMTGWKIHPYFTLCVGCTRFDPGEPPKEYRPTKTKQLPTSNSFLFNKNPIRPPRHQAAPEADATETHKWEGAFAWRNDVKFKKWREKA